MARFVSGDAAIDPAHRMACCVLRLMRCRERAVGLTHAALDGVVARDLIGAPKLCLTSAHRRDLCAEPIGQATKHARMTALIMGAPGCRTHELRRSAKRL